LVDPRGVGSSDPVPLGALPTAEQASEDALIVLDAVGSESAIIFGHGPMGGLALLFAAAHPGRTRGLILMNAYARRLRAGDYPSDLTEAEIDGVADALTEIWGTGRYVEITAPSRAGDENFRRWHAWMERLSAPPALFRAFVGWIYRLDLRAALDSVRVPTLVLYRDDDPLDYRRIDSEYLAAHISGARLVAVPGRDYHFFTERADDILDQVEEFVTGAPPVRETDRALATVLFTDIVASTEHATRLGDRKWTQLLEQHDAIIRRELERHRGRRVNPTGDGVLASFDGPARGVRCARAIIDAVRPLGVDLRAGLHCGEVELRGDDIGGIAVHIGQRVSALAGPGEVLVSSTVKELVAGSGITFADRGMHQLKGVTDEWRLFAVES
jgi:class 3 adenylate cyclase